MAEVLLSNGMAALIDDADLHLIDGLTWCAANTKTKNSDRWYAMAWNKGRGGSVYMHRLVMGAEKGQYVDHIDGNSLNNYRANLRFCTLAQNNGNARWATGSSGFRGVHATRSGKWSARIAVMSREIRLGTFKRPEDAAMAYDKAALEYFGEFATLNFREA
jgi:hypothetical protein